MRLDQREFELLTTQPRRLVLGEVADGIGVGPRRPIGGALEQRVTERLELRRDVRFTPRTQGSDTVSERRRR
ncbi:MAG: hypothetical protein QOK16_2255 [Solirubrobacteraceae bacterium]|nr:hypothetical protein [Solirubrobacteraceae bacterium]